MPARKKIYRVSVYGEVLVRRGGYVKPYVRKGRRVRGYVRRPKYEQRRWDLRSSDRKKLKEAVAKIRREKLAPRVRHKRLTAENFLKRWKEYIDRRKLGRERARS